MTRSWNWRCEAGFRQRFVPSGSEKRVDSRGIKGSHHVFMKEGRHERIVIPIHGNRPLKLGLLRAQMKIAGLTEEEL